MSKAHQCQICSPQRGFASRSSYLQHKRDKHGGSNLNGYISEYSSSSIGLDAPVETPGQWVLRKDFVGQKSFGFFKCQDCQETWISAHAFKLYKQGCKTCETYFLPMFMWVNAEQRRRNPGDQPVLDLDREKLTYVKPAGVVFAGN